MQLDGFGEADRFAGQPLDAGAQRQMLAFNLLRVALARYVGLRSQLPRVGSPVVSEETADAKGLQQGCELQEHLVLAAAEHVCQDFPRPVIAGMPQPPRFFLLAHIAPHLIDLRGLYPADAYCHLTGMQALKAYPDNWDLIQ